MSALYSGVLLKRAMAAGSFAPLATFLMSAPMDGLAVAAALVKYALTTSFGLGGKVELAEPVERRGERVDRVVLARQ